mmetsp:Transcript_41732/g.88942  ORF Transcript_41732/g.88942 Transcript_41732/m.88942 type:complete len:128 (+) Transcript_41732:82-465(+)
MARSDFAKTMVNNDTLSSTANRHSNKMAASEGEAELKEFSNNNEGGNGNGNGNGKDSTAITRSLTYGARGATQELNGNKGIELATNKSSEEERLFKMHLRLNEAAFQMQHSADIDASSGRRPLPVRQ